MKRNFSRFLALVFGITIAGNISAGTSASALYWWGNANNAEFTEMQLLDDKGMFKWIGYGGVPGTPRDYQVYTQHYSQDVEAEVTYADTSETKIETTNYEGDNLYVVMPRNDTLRIVFRSDIDEEEAKREAVTILRKYYPELLVDADSAGFPASFYPISAYIYELHDRSETVGSEEVSVSIMKELAQAGLISEFYSWGQITDYQQVGNTYPTAYYPTIQKWNSSYTALEDVAYDWDAIEAWVTKHYPECKLTCVTRDDAETAKLIGQYDSALNKVFYDNNIEQMYAIIPPDGTAFSDHFAIAAELYEQFGLAAQWECPASINEQMLGQNALAVAGDINIDCKINVSDAVLIARIISEDATLNLTYTGMNNADVDGDGLLSIHDMSTLLKKLTNPE